MRRQDQRGDGQVRQQPLDVLGGQVVQPAETVRARDAHDVAARQVDDALAGEQGFLLAERVAVVRGESRVDAVGLDRPGKIEEGAALAAARHRRHSAQAPKIVRWPTSATNPSESWRAWSIGATTAGATSVTAPQSRQMRWR